MIPITLPRFDLGQVVARPGAAEVLNRAGQSVWSILSRHISEDWSECDDEDRAANDRAVEDGDRILSVYRLSTGETLWVITEADRSSTCICRPDEY